MCYVSKIKGHDARVHRQDQYDPWPDRIGNAFTIVTMTRGAVPLTFAAAVLAAGTGGWRTEGCVLVSIVRTTQTLDFFLKQSTTNILIQPSVSPGLSFAV